MKVSFLFLVALSTPLTLHSADAIKTIKRPPSAAKKIQQAPKPKPAVKKEEPAPGLWPCFDALDKRLIMISIPMIINFSITPLVCTKKA